MAKRCKKGAVISIKNNGELHSKTELDILRKEHEELKKAFGGSTLGIKVLKKGGNRRTKKLKLQRYQENSN